MQKLKNNEARPKFTGSYKKNACAAQNDGNILFLFVFISCFSFVSTSATVLCKPYNFDFKYFFILYYFAFLLARVAFN